MNWVTTVKFLGAWGRVGAMLLGLSACTSVRVDMPPMQARLPDHFDAVDSPAATGADLARWWQALNDPVLTHYIEEGLQHNLDVRVALARIQEARAYHGMAESAFYPTVEASAGASRSRQTSHLPVEAQPSMTLPLPLPVTIALPPVSQDFRTPLGNTTAAGLSATWEIDLFGARHADAEMVHQLVLGAQEQQHGAQLLVAADIANHYFEARGAEKRLDVLQRAVQVAERGHQYARGRFQSGQTDASEVDKAEMTLRAAQAQIEPLKALIASHVRRIAVLMGRPPQGLTALPPPPAAARRITTLPAVLPGEVLARRPDVRGAARKVRSQMAKLGSARAELFPKFYLGFGASAGRLHPDHEDGENFGAQTLGIGMRLPIFNAGRIRANIAANQAQLAGVAAQYEQTVLGALEDVDNVYTAHKAFADKQLRLAQAATLAQQVAQRKMALFKSGQELLHNALEAQAVALQREDEAIQADTTLDTYTVLLYKALGGGWSDDPSDDHVGEAGGSAYAAAATSP
ncbi:MAG: TolC family protein [Burkholderiales bacterium]|nr:TolC family protein [Burkholderiales bacterium]MDE2433712.1 TolC family protein [Burkholderiales bacterium]